MISAAERSRSKPTQAYDPALDALPDSYARWRRSTLGRLTDAVEQELLLARIGRIDGLEILDIGCGDGVLATELAGRGANVGGLDISPATLLAARRRARASGVELALTAGNAAKLPYPDASFDLVLSVATLCFSETPLPALREMHRVLRPGGRLVLGELARWNTWAMLRRVKGWFGSALWRAAIFRSARALAKLVQSAGLREAEIKGAVFYPPCGAAAFLLAPIDRWIGRFTKLGAAFFVLTATKPDGAAAPPP